MKKLSLRPAGHGTGLIGAWAGTWFMMSSSAVAQVPGQAPGQLPGAPILSPSPAAGMPPMSGSGSFTSVIPGSPPPTARPLGSEMNVPTGGRTFAAGATGNVGAPAPSGITPGMIPPVPFAASDPQLRAQLSAQGGLTSDEVAARAQATSFDAAARHEAMNAAQAKLDQAVISFYPKISLLAKYSKLSPIDNPAFNPNGTLIALKDSVAQPVPPAGSDPVAIQPGSVLAIAAPRSFPTYNDQYFTQANLTIPISDYVLRTSQSLAAASHSQKAAQIDEQAARLKAATDARLAYYAWLRAKAQVVVSEQAVQRSRGHLNDDQASLRVGSAARSDILRAESVLASSQLVLERARNLVDLSEDQIRTAMHDNRQMSYTPGEDLLSDLPPLQAVDNLEALRNEAMSRRLEVRALDETVWSFNEQAHLAKAGNWPRLDGFADVIYANPHPRFFPQTDAWKLTWDVGVQVTWTPNDMLNASGVGAEAKARAAQTEMQKLALRDAIRAEVLQGFQALREAESAVATSARTLASADESYRVRRELFKNGRATSVDLSDSELEVFRARLEAVNARADVRSARARVIHAVGRDIVEAPPVRP